VVSLLLYGYPRFWHAAQVPFLVLVAGAALHLFDERATIRRVLSPPVAVERLERLGAGGRVTTRSRDG
jgi:hypothetical protein